MTSGGHGGCWSCSQDSKGIRRGGGGLLPLNCTVASLSSDTVHVVLRAEHLAVAVTLDISGNSSEVLSTVCGGLPRSCARDLPGKNVVCLSCGISTATPCESHGDGVGGCCPKFSVHVIARVSSTDRWRVNSCLSSHCQGVVAGSCRC